MTRKPSLRFTAATLSLLVALPVGAAPAAAAPPVTLEQIMADNDWIGNPPEDAYWSDDGRSVYYLRERDGEGKNPRDLFRVDLASGQTVKVEPADYGKVDAPGGDRSRDGKWKVYARQGDIFLKDLTTGGVRQITRTAERETAPRFLADGRRFSFRRGPAVFVYDGAAGLLSQPAEIKLEKDPTKEDDPDFLAAQQTRLFDIIRQQQETEKRDREEELAHQKADPTRPPLPWYFGKKVEVQDADLSPAGDFLAVVTAPNRTMASSSPRRCRPTSARAARSRSGTSAQSRHRGARPPLHRHPRPREARADRPRPGSAARHQGGSPEGPQGGGEEAQGGGGEEGEEEGRQGQEGRQGREGQGQG